MITYILRRILIAIPLLWGILTINFTLIHLAPGEPTDIYENPDISPEALVNIRKSYGLDQPLLVQYFKYMEQVLFHFEFGVSFAKKRPVADEILDALPNTLLLSSLALILELSLGISIGIIAAMRRNSYVDNSARVLALTFYSMPPFYLGLLLLLLFSGGVFLWLPASGVQSLVGYESMSLGEKFLDRLKHIFLPAITLALGGAAATSRYMRGQLLEVIQQDFIRTARAKGLPERIVVFKHGLRNALMPIVTLIGLSLPVLFSGAVIVESVFAWPGMGRVAVDAAFSRDYPVFLAENLIFACLVVAGSLVSDILYAIVDPRVRLS